MAFFPLSANGEGSERVSVGVEYNDANLRLTGLFFQGAVTRDLSVRATVRYDPGAGEQLVTAGPFEAKNTQTGRILNLTGLGLFMREVEKPQGDEPDDPVVLPGETMIVLPAEVISVAVEWGINP